jgi:hypothetical protein
VQLCSLPRATFTGERSPSTFTGPAL